MRVMGIDPGTVVVGYGVVDGRGDSVTMVDYGALKCPPRAPIPERLSKLYEQICAVIVRHRPDAVAVETPFVGQNVSSALAVGKAQAVAILAAANRGIPVHEYSPAQIKQRVSNYGGSSKEQMQKMVSLQLGLSGVPEPHDAADALATALCHISEMHLQGLLAEGVSE